MSLQPFESDSIALNFETVRFSFNRPNRSIKIVGDKTPGFLCFVCLPHGISRPVISHELLIGADHLYGFDLNRGMNQVFPSNPTY